MKLRRKKKTKPTAQPKRSISAEPIELKRILVPIDFSDYSKHALGFAVQLAQKFDSGLILVYVVEPAVYPADLGFGQVVLPAFESELTERGKSGLEQLAATSIPKGIGSRLSVRTGKPYLEILKTAEEEKVDLIVIATHGHTAVEHLLFGSTAEKVLKRAGCPVLIVRAASQEGGEKD